MFENTILEVEVQGDEFWDSEHEEFIKIPSQTLRLEHSLFSISKWESKWKLSFFEELKKFTAKDEKFLYYIKCMTINEVEDNRIYSLLTIGMINEIIKFIEDPMTATRISNRGPSGPTSRYVSSELIYSWMVALNIPFECQHWPLNRLMMLIQCCEKNNTPSKKMSKAESARYQAQINAARRKAHK